MNSERKCGQCGKPIPEDAGQGLCPPCLFDLALQAGQEETEGQGTDGTAPSDTASIPPQSPLAAPPTTEAHPPPAAPAASPGEQPGDRIGRYKLLQLLGDGGMGDVWMAEQTEPVRRMVALKLIKPGMDSKEVLARFEAERQALALMDHPNIARVLDAGATPNGRPYFVMDLVKGMSLIRFCDEQRLSLPERLALFIPVCQAIQHAHQKGIIHRDIKPSNVLVALYDGKPVPKVIDFGIAKATGQRLTAKTLFTQLGARLGTPEYMSPEQAELNQLDIDTRSDIYSLGVLLYELLTGTTPLTHEKVRQAVIEEILRRIREEEPPKPSERLTTNREQLPAISEQRKLDPEKLPKMVKGELDWIVMKALEKERDRRYETASGLASDIQKYLNGEPPVAGPTTARYRVKKFVRKHRRTVAVAAGFVVLLAVGSVVSTGLAVRANRLAKEADGQRQRAEEKSSLEALAKRETQAANRQLGNLVTQLELQKVDDLLAKDQSGPALALMARVLRREPTNQVVATRIVSTLTMRPVALPAVPPLVHDDEVYFAQFSPDGQLVSTASRDKTAQVWDANSGKPLGKPLMHTGAVVRAIFSPDGQWVATASRDKSARVWNALTGEPVFPPLWHTGAVNYIDFSPDGRWLATASSDRTARIWDARTGQPLTDPLLHEGGVGCICFSPDGKWVATGVLASPVAPRSPVRVWDANTGQPVTPPLRHGLGNYVRFSHDSISLAGAGGGGPAMVWEVRTGRVCFGVDQKIGGNVMMINYSPDGLRLVGPSEKGLTFIWDARTGRLLTEPLRHNSVVCSAMFSPDGNCVVTASADGTVQIWDTMTGRLVFAPMPHAGRVNYAEFSRDSRRVVAACRSGQAQIWDTAPGKPTITSYRHQHAITRAQFSPNGSRILLADRNNCVSLWSPRTGRLPWPATDIEGSLHSASFSPDGARILAEVTLSARIWNAYTGDELFDVRYDPSIGHLRDAQFSPDGTLVAIGTWDGRVQVWDIHKGQQIGNIPTNTSMIRAARFSSDSRLVVGRASPRIDIWEFRTGKLVAQAPAHQSGLRAFELSRDGRLGVSCASEDGSALVWDTMSGQLVGRPLRHSASVLTVQFSPDGRRVLTSSLDKAAQLWDVGTGLRIGQPMQHEAGVLIARFSPDGGLILTASDDNVVRVWDGHTGLPLTEPQRYHTKQITGADFSPDSKRVMTYGQDGLLCLWDVPEAPLPVVEWLPRLAEAAAGQHFAVPVIAEPAAESELWKLGCELRASANNDGYTRWAKWFFADRATRPASPWSDLASEAATNSRSAAAMDPEAISIWSEPVPADPNYWEFVGKHLVKSNRLDEACQALTKALELANTNIFPATRSRVLLRRSSLLRQMNRPQEAEADREEAEASRLAALGIPLRGTHVMTNLIDLSGFYNASLTNDVGEAGRGNNLLALPQGVQRLAGVEFDIRGLVHLSGAADERLQGAVYPRSICAVPLNQKFTSMHLLHGTGWATNDTTTIGAYILHYTDGQKVEFPIVYGEHMRSFWSSASGQWVKGSTVAWVGENEAAKQRGKRLCLYKTTWNNPRPDVEVAGLDFVSTMTECPPFLIAITVETLDSEDYWEAQAKELARRGDLAAAFAAIDKGIQRVPDSPLAWNVKGQLLATADQLDGAHQSFTRAIELAGADTNRFQEALAEALLNRSSLLRQMNRIAEAGVDNCRARGIPARDLQAKLEQIDLSSLYNAALTNSVASGEDGNNLAEFPQGLQRMAGVDFDLRGFIQLSAARLKGTKRDVYPSSVAGIPINRKLTRFHFLHGAVWHGTAETRVGSYLVHYADGQTNNVPILYGENIQDFWYYKPDKERLDGALVAWTGSNVSVLLSPSRPAGLDGVGWRDVRPSWLVWPSRRWESAPPPG